jgi:midasin (ATPase involved in ribosome maturation)
VIDGVAPPPPQISLRTEASKCFRVGTHLSLVTLRDLFAWNVREVCNLQHRVVETGLLGPHNV